MSVHRPCPAVPWGAAALGLLGLLEAGLGLTGLPKPGKIQVPTTPALYQQEEKIGTSTKALSGAPLRVLGLGPFVPVPSPGGPGEEGRRGLAPTYFNHLGKSRQVSQERKNRDLPKAARTGSSQNLFREVSVLLSEDMGGKWPQGFQRTSFLRLAQFLQPEEVLVTF